MKQLDNSIQFTTFRQYLASKSTEAQGTSAKQNVDYSHPIDGWITKNLNATPVKAVMNKALDKLISIQFGAELANGVVMDQSTMPDLYEVLRSCTNTLSIPMPYSVISASLRGQFNAYTAGTDSFAFIVISPALVESFSPEACQFIIGHECGHIACDHMMYHTLAELLTGALAVQAGLVGNVLKVVAGVPLNAWSRRSEITADRAGLLCCQDINVAEKVLTRLATGLTKVDGIDIDVYLKRSKNAEAYHNLSKFGELWQRHPMVFKRIEALRLFTRSEIYYSLTDTPPPDGQRLLTQAELNRLVNQIIQP